MTDGATAAAVAGYTAISRTFAAFSSGNVVAPADDQPSACREGH
jgi:hypothetical protein